MAVRISYHAIPRLATVPFMKNRRNTIALSDAARTKNAPPPGGAEGTGAVYQFPDEEEEEEEEEIEEAASLSLIICCKVTRIAITVFSSSGR